MTSIEDNVGFRCGGAVVQLVFLVFRCFSFISCYLFYFSFIFFSFLLVVSIYVTAKD